MGADDYITKPFSVAALVARVRSQLRRVELLHPRKQDIGDKGITSIGRLKIDERNHTVSIDSKSTELTSTEFGLLLFFGNRPDQVFFRANLLDKVWGYDHLGYEHTVNSHINSLRRKLEPFDKDSTIIQTVWGVGYKLSSESCQ